LAGVHHNITLMKACYGLRSIHSSTDGCD
jgi:hypothetical protein